MARNGAIGVGGKLPWHLPGDLSHFKAITMGKPIVMGRATFDSIGRALPGRTNIVLTRREGWSASGVHLAPTPREALAIARAESPQADVCIIGGGQIYELFIPQADRLEITAVEAEPDGDAHFPDWDRSEWRLIAESQRRPGPPPYGFQTWQRVSAKRYA